MDWQFGEAPNLDPAIVQALEWKLEAGKEQNGRVTLPAGPIRWEYDDGNTGSLVATSRDVTSSQGLRRTRVGLRPCNRSRCASCPLPRVELEKQGKKVEASFSQPPTSEKAHYGSSGNLEHSKP